MDRIILVWVTYRLTSILVWILQVRFVRPALVTLYLKLRTCVPVAARGLVEFRCNIFLPGPLSLVVFFSPYTLPHLLESRH